MELWMWSSYWQNNREEWEAHCWWWPWWSQWPYLPWDRIHGTCQAAISWDMCAMFQSQAASNSGWWPMHAVATVNPMPTHLHLMWPKPTLITSSHHVQSAAPWRKLMMSMSMWGASKEGAGWPSNLQGNVFVQHVVLVENDHPCGGRYSRHWFKFDPPNLPLFFKYWPISNFNTASLPALLTLAQY